jgi:hypothetical protein
VRAFLAIGVVATACVSGQSQTPATSCEQVGRQQFLPTVPEASGIAHAGGVLWTHNDSGAPVLFRLDAAGTATPVSVAGTAVQDWEDLTAGTCGAGACLYIADIGDNNESRARITIYEVPVPAPGSTSTKPVTAIHVRYPDYPHDAEALLITRKIGAFIITKEVPARVYTFAASQIPGETGTLRLFRTLNEKVRITGAAVSPDEGWIAVRSNSTLLLYRLDDFAKGGSPVRVDLAGFKEPQGEGVAFGSGGDLYLVSEGGKGSASGMLTRIHCGFIQ